MIRIVFIIPLLLSALFVSSEVLHSKMESARVFLRSAEIHRSAQTQLHAGNSQVIISGLPLDLLAESIQMQGNGNFDILSVRHRTDHLISPELEKGIQDLQDSLEYYNRLLIRQQNMLKVYEEEETFLLANRSVGGSESGIKLADLKGISDFFRSRLMEIKNLQQQTQDNLTSTRDRQQRIRRQLNEQNAQKQRAVGQIVVDVYATRSVRAKFNFSYISNQAGWQPVYDLRAADTSGTIELIMKARVFQNTGEEWNDVDLTLSTGTPSLQKEKPSLSPWYLRFMQPPITRQGRPHLAPQMLMEAAEVESYNMDREDTGRGMRDFEVTQTHTSFEYHVAPKQSIPSANKNQLVDLHTTELKAIFEHYAVPRLTSDVFLMAKIADWEEFVKLPGEVNVFFEGSYVGKTQINPQITSDTLDLSMGIDKSITVERKRLTDFSKKSMLGRRTTETVAWELVARNNKNQTITINLEDQIPLSSHQDIEVSLEEKSNALHEAHTGFLHWRETLNPNQNLNRTFKYTVRYPSDKDLVIE